MAASVKDPLSNIRPALDVLAGRSSWCVIEGEALALLSALPDESVDAVIADPPYSSGGQYRGDRMKATGEKYVTTGMKLRRPDFEGDNRDQRSFAYWSTLWLSECLRVAKPGAVMCVFSDWRQFPTTTDAVQSGGWVWRGVVAWDKTEAARPRLGGFRAQSEFVVWASKGPIDDERARLVGALPGAFRIGVTRRDKHHQTGKPTALMRELVRVCPPGGVVLDPFAGSGTTLVAALATGRRSVGIERNAEYLTIARQRCAEERGPGESERGAA